MTLWKLPLGSNTSNQEMGRRRGDSESRKPNYHATLRVLNTMVELTIEAGMAYRICDRLVVS